MVATKSTPRQQHTWPTNHSPSGAAGERLELLRLRDSDDLVARAAALGFLQVLRRLDDIAAGMGVEA